MATSNSKLVSAAKPLAAGAISAGPTSAKVPTTADEELPGELVKLGYVNDEGLTNAIEMESDSIKAWGGATILTTKTGRTETFEFTLVQSLDPDVLKEVYGQDNVTGTLDAGITVKHNGKDMPHRMFVFDMLMTGNAVKRIVVADAQVTEVAEVKHADGEPVGYTVTLTCYPNQAGDTVIEYIKATA